MKGKEDAIIKNIYVTSQSWKAGIRKIQSKLTTFYEIKMKYFNTINKCANLGLSLKQVEEK